MTVDWPTEAREAVAQAVAEVTGTMEDAYTAAAAVLAALAPHVQPRTDDWEWGVKWETGRVTLRKSRSHAETTIQAYPGYTLARRRPASGWEVAP